MGNVVKKRNYCVSSIVLMLTIGGIFSAIGIALAVIVISGIISRGIIALGAGIIVPIIFTLALLGFGSFGLFMGGKQIYLWIRGARAQKIGKDGVAKIIGNKTVRTRKNTRIRHALVLSYQDGEKIKTFTTDYIFDINEFRYLRKLKNIKIKIDGNFVAVSEPFENDIYKLDSTYGIEISFFKQKSVKVTIRLWALFLFAALAFLIAAMIAGNSAVTNAAIIIIFTEHFPFAILLAVLLIKWYKRKK